MTCPLRDRFLPGGDIGRRRRLRRVQQQLLYCVRFRVQTWICGRQRGTPIFSRLPNRGPAQTLLNHWLMRSSRAVYHLGQRQQDCVDNERRGCRCRCEGEYWSEVSSLRARGTCFVFRASSSRLTRVGSVFPQFLVYPQSGHSTQLRRPRFRTSDVPDVDNGLLVFFCLFYRVPR